MKQVLANDFRRQWLETRDDVLEAVETVGASGWYILGNEVEAFEKSLAEYCNADFAVGCANGLDALEISLRAAGLEPGDKVLTTPLTAFATTLAILRAGGCPVFVDVDKQGLLDMERAEAALAKHSDIRFIMPVHLYGFLVDIERLRLLSEQYGVTVIEDAAQAINANERGNSIGGAGLAACISFYPTKNLGAMGDGGAIITHDSDFAKSCRQLRDYGQVGKYQHSVYGMNSRLDELQAAILSKAFLPRLEAWSARRTQIAKTYLKGISNPLLHVLAPELSAKPAWHLFPVLVLNGKRDAFLEDMKTQGVQCNVHYPRLVTEQGLWSKIQRSPEAYDPLTEARNFAENEVSLPIHPQMTDDEASYVIQTVNEWTEQ